jgi:hypothetical protein
MDRKKKILIGFSGKIGSGKDYMGELAKMHLGSPTHPNIEIKKFADKLKEMTCLLIGCTREQLENRDFKKTELTPDWWVNVFKEPAILAYSGFVPDNNLLKKWTPREVLQVLGSLVRNNIHPDAWVNSTFTDYKSDSDWIITDVRYPNEANRILNLGGKVFRVRRELVSFKGDDIIISDGLVGGTRIASPKRYGLNKALQDFRTEQNEGAHESETALDDFENFSGYIENYHEGPDRVLQEFKAMLWK